MPLTEALSRLRAMPPDERRWRAQELEREALHYERMGQVEIAEALRAFARAVMA